ncbi:hypothetical protein ADT25_22620 [Xanthomonas oryzae]|uniref:FUSC family protein n=1 Tax=Xanthomonas oryzae TaxID=347 RepID=A0AAP1EUR4_9XANT|nr:hypothetical protein ADT25_22620 [Xanthomonas oryzae]QBG86393.1 FUSC family protein [Xanthomonas oryzae]
MNAFLHYRQAWLFSVKTFAASIAALYVALAGNLSRPYWAMATVYIVSQPLLGPARAKGLYRVLGTLSDLAAVDMLNAVRVGFNILQLRSARHGLPASSRDAVDAILRDVAAHDRQQVAQKRPLPGPDALRDRLDASLTRVGKVPAEASRDDALLGLIGLRYSLFANAPSETHGVTEQRPALATLPSGR